MKLATLVSFLASLSLALGCIDAVVTKTFDGDALSEEFGLYDTVTGARLCYYKQGVAFSFPTKTFNVCLEPFREYKLAVDKSDIYSGWGNHKSSNSKVTITSLGMVLISATLPYGDSLKSLDFYFNPGFIVVPNSNWQYTDAPQSDDAWKAADYDASSWAAASSFPSLTATRYYRYVVDLPVSNTTVNAIEIGTIVNSGYVLYINGQEVTRQYMPTGEISSSTPALSSDSVTYYKRIAVSGRQFVTSSTLVIGLEVHLLEGQTEAADPFNAFVRIDTGDASTRIRGFIDGVGTCAASYSDTANEKCESGFDGFSAFKWYGNDVQPMWISFSFNEGRRDWIGKYSIISGNDLPERDPMTWKLYGSNDNVNFHFLDYRTNQYFSSRRQTMDFFLPSNRVPYNTYKLEILSVAGGSQVQFADLLFYSTNTTPLEPGIIYENTYFELNVGINDINIAPISSGYYSYTISPSLPEGLSFDPNTGAIMGTPTTVAPDSSYNVCATDGATEQVHCTTLTIVTVGCAQPSFSRFDITKINKAKGSTESWKMYNSDGELIIESTGLNNENQNWNFCIPAGIYQFDLTDGDIDGWDSGSMLVVSMFGTGEVESTRYTLGRLTVMYVGTQTYYINSKMSIWSNNHWRYQLVDSSFDPAWAQGSFDDQSWPEMTVPSETTSRIWLFRKQFELTSRANYTGFLMRLYSNTGFIVYANGVEFYRYHVTEGDLSMSTLPTSPESVFSWKSFTGDLRLLNLGTNTIAVAVVNPAEISQPLISTYDSILILLCSSSKVSRTWDIVSTDDGHRNNGDASNLFDYNKDSRYIANISMNETRSVQISFLNRAEYINKYCFTSHFDAPQHDPRDWNIYVSHDNGNSFSLVASESDIFFDGRGERQCFFFVNSYQPATDYKFEFTHPREDRETNAFALSELELLLENLEDLSVPDLAYTPNVIQAYRNQPFPALSISSLYYHHFTVSPPLPTGLTLDYGDGQIMGSTSEIVTSAVYTITALNHLNVEKSTTLTISVVSCHNPNTLFSLEFVFEEKGYEASFELYRQATSELIDSRPSIVSYFTSVYTYCSSATIYSLVLHDTANDGWGSGSYRVLLEDGTVLTTGTVSPGSSPLTVSINVGYVINPLNSIWRYTKTQITDPQWTSLSFDDSQWSTAPLTSISSLDTTTIFLRFPFEAVDLDLYSNYEINIYALGGFIAYMNGQEIYRENLPADGVSASTFGESENTEWTKYSISLSVQFNSIVSGQNILALEYHRRQADDTSSQLRVFMTMILDNTYRIIEGTFWSDEILTGNEGTDKLFDNSPDTKLCRGSTGIGNQFSWIYTNRREVINRYTIISANDCNKRHPSGWNLEGSNDDVEYTLLHSTTGQYFTSFKQAKTYNIPNTVAYKYYRLTITEMNNSKINWIENCPGDNFQLSEFQLFTARLNNPCLPVDGYPAVLNGDFGRKSCPANYEGYYQRRCNDGVYGEEEDLCTLSVPTVSYPASPYTVLQNLTMTSIVPITTGLTEVFSIAPPLPAGVSFDISTGVLSGQPAELSPSTEYTVTVANSAGSSSTTFFFMVDTYRCPAEGSWSAITIGSSITIDCPDPVNYEGSLSRTCFMGESEAYWSDVTDNCEMRAPVISYQSTSYSFFVGQPIAAIVPQVTYIVDAGFTVEPNLPAGLVLDPATGSVSGTPSVISPMNEYVVTASNTGGKTGTAVLSLAVVTTDCAAELPWPTTPTGQVASVPCTPTDIYEGYQTRLCTLSVWGVPDTSACLLRYPYGVTYPAVISVAKDFQMNPVTPSYMGQVDSWSITPMLPTGLSFDTATGTISGTAYSEGEYTFSVTAINARGSSFVSIVIHVVDTICDYDDWPHTEVGQTASKPCDEEGDYDGQQTCVCLNGTPAYFGPVDRSQCRKKAPTDILYSPSTITVTLGEPILMTATFKHIVEDIVISPPLPNGLVLNHLTGEISGISTQATSRVDYTLIFKNSDRSSSPVGITISIVSTVCNAESGWSETTKGETASKACDNPSIYEGLQTRPCIDGGSGFSPYWGNVNTSQCKKRAPYNIALSQSEIITYVGQTIMVSSTYSGLVENVVVDPALPTGLSLTVTGTISGTASAVLSRQEFNLIFKNSDNQSEAVVLAITILRNHCLEDGIWGSTIMNSYANAPCENTQNYEGFRARYCSVVEPNTAPEWGEVTSTCTKKAPFNIQYPTLTVYAEVGTIVNVVPSYSGIVESVSINPALPPGLSYSSLTGAITGTPTTISELTTYYITFSNSDASASPVSISIVVVRSTCLTDGIWLETGKGQTLSLPCNDPDNYEGNQFRLCIAGGLGSHPTWSTINTSQCKKRAPYNVFYSTIVGEFGVYMNEAPNVHGIVESVEITPALPAGLTYSLSTGVISGSPSTVIVPTEYTAIFRNSDSASVPYVFTIEIKGYCLEDNDWAKTERGQTAYIPCYSGVGVQRRQCGVSSTDMDYVWQTVDASDCLLASREDTPEYGFVHLYVPLQIHNVDASSVTAAHQYQLRTVVFQQMKSYVASLQDVLILSVESSKALYAGTAIVNLRFNTEEQNAAVLTSTVANYTTSDNFKNELVAIDETVFSNAQVEVTPSNIQTTNGPALSTMMVIIIVVVVVVIVIVIAIVVVMKDKKSKTAKIVPKTTGNKPVAKTGPAPKSPTTI